MQIIDFFQKLNNVLSKTCGNKKPILDFQLYINKKRAENDEPDHREIIVNDDGKSFVQ